MLLSQKSFLSQVGHDTQYKNSLVISQPVVYQIFKTWMFNPMWSVEHIIYHILLIVIYIADF